MGLQDLLREQGRAVSRAPGIIALVGILFFGLGFLAGDRPGLAPAPDLAAEQIALLRSELLSITETLATARQANLPGWIAVAVKEIGEEEVAGIGNNPRILEYVGAVQTTESVQDDVIEWASPFVEWCLNQVGITGPKDLNAVSWLQWGQKVEEPAFGAVVVFSFGHVGFVLRDDGDHLRVLGGNQGNAVTVKRYAKADVIGYRLPEATGGKSVPSPTQ